jgi:hypothetical protein
VTEDEVSQDPSQNPLQDPYTYKVNHTPPNIMEDTLWTEIAEAPGEIFDIPELRDLDEDYQNDETTWNAFLNSNWDF